MASVFNWASFLHQKSVFIYHENCSPLLKASSKQDSWLLFIQEAVKIVFQVLLQVSGVCEEHTMYEPGIPTQSCLFLKFYLIRNLFKEFSAICWASWKVIIINNFHWSCLCLTENIAEFLWWLVFQLSLETTLKSALYLCEVRVGPSLEMVAFWRENERKYYPFRKWDAVHGDRRLLVYEQYVLAGNADTTKLSGAVAMPEGWMSSKGTWTSFSSGPMGTS